MDKEEKIRKEKEKEEGKIKNNQENYTIDFDEGDLDGF